MTTLHDLMVERDRAYQAHITAWNTDAPDYAAWNAYRSLDEQVQAHPIMRAIARFEEDSYTPNALMVDALIAAAAAESPAALADLATAHALLAEWVKGEDAGYNQWGMQPYQATCQHCDWDARIVDGSYTYPHTPDCIVTRTRAALVADGAGVPQEDT